MVPKKEVLSFEKFFYFLLQNIGNLVKKEAIANHTGIGIKTVEKYLQLIYKTMMIFPVYPYFLDKTKEYSSHPKIYFSDVGILSFLERSYGDKTSNGRTVENFVFGELLKSKQSTYDEIKTYKKLTKSEIDFIYEYTNDTIVPIEVKSGNNRAIPRIFHTIHSDIPHTEACIQTSFSLYQYQPLVHLDYYQIPNCLIGKVPEMFRKRVLL